MLRIESYVTPIILSYVNKYIKNLKPEDSQVSLWGGDAVFNNLDLRLDVLEQELRLPFTFINGHIHELRIHVPWTKLTSEPIVITINTIECILKLKDTESGDSETLSQTDSSSGRTTDFKKRGKQQELEVPATYIQGLMNKIINNVSIVCNNVILKYVEDDIVLSINVKTLEHTTVDDLWKAAFVDMTPEDLTLRNLAKLTDLTVCLDKRNAAGKIENYQEPLLYRCSLTCRIIRSFDSVNSSQSTAIRCDTYCPQLHFSVSDTQLPMFLRLLQLLMALYYGQLQDPATIECKNEPPSQENFQVNPTEGLSTPANDDDDSWSSWAWSMGTAILPIYWDDLEPTELAKQQKRDKILHFGVYAEIATWVFKITEQTSENLLSGPSRTKFTPFLTIQQQGSYSTVVLKGFEAVNAQFGVSSMTVDPTGCCICGLDDTELSSVATTKQPVQEGIYAKFGTDSQQYLTMSLFEDAASTREPWNYDYSWDSHHMTVTESMLLEKTPAFVSDYLYVLELPNKSEMSYEELSNIQYNLECSNASEHSLSRFAVGPCEIHINSGFVHRLQSIQCALQLYDYAPYASPYIEPAPPGLDAPTAEEIHQLELMTPLRTFNVTFIEPKISLYAAQHPFVDVKSILFTKSRKKNQRASTELCMATVLSVPCMTLKVGRLDLELVKPFYGKRLVAAACRVRNPSPELLHNCHMHMSAKLVHASISMTNETDVRVDLMRNFSWAAYRKLLLLPTWWAVPNMPREELHFEADRFCIWMSMPQARLLTFIVCSWTEVFPCPEDLHRHSLVRDAIDHSDRFHVMLLKMHSLEGDFCRTEFSRSLSAKLGTVSLALCHPNHDIHCLLLSGPETPTGVDVLSNEPSTKCEKLLQFCLQWSPTSGSEASKQPLLVLSIGKMAFLVDPLLVSWLKYSEKTLALKEANILALRKIGEVRPRSVPKLSRKMSDGDSSLALTSSSFTMSDTRTSSYLPFFSQTVDRPATFNWQATMIDFHPFLSNLIVRINVESTTVFLATTPLNVVSNAGLIDIIYRIYLPKKDKRCGLGDTTVINLPRIQIRNSAQRTAQLDTQTLPVIVSSAIASLDKLPWSLELSQFHAYSLQCSGPHVRLSLLKHCSATATLSLAPKYQDAKLVQLGLVIHVDMAPLHCVLNRRQVKSHILLCNNYLSLLSHLKLNRFAKPAIVISETKAATKGQHIPVESSLSASQAQKTRSQEDAMLKNEAKTPIETKANEPLQESKDVAEVVESPKVDDTNVTIWIQWTLARISLTLFTLDESEARKLKADLEELTFSVDIQRVYCKVIGKIANANVLHFDKSETSWQPGEYQGVLMSSVHHITEDLTIYQPEASKHHKAAPKAHTKPDQSKSHGFLTLTFTIAESVNAYSRWNQVVRKNFGEERFVKECLPSLLYEIDVRVSSFDVIIFAPIFEAFASVFDPCLGLHVPLALRETVSRQKDAPFGLTFNNKNLPLVYFVCDVIRVFVPVLADNKIEHDVVFGQIEAISIAPQVDNPLSRVILREDLYSAAVQARILGIPGSEVEDRQYQIDLLGTSISTGSWKDIVKVNSTRPRSSSAELLGVRGENPAFEWNNYDPNAASTTEAVFVPLLSRLDIKTIVAPAIVFNNDRDAQMLVVVAGHSVEVNATSDVKIFVSLVQLQLLQKLMNDVQRSISSLTQHKDARRQSLLTDVPDSGVECDQSSLDLRRDKSDKLTSVKEETDKQTNTLGFLDKDFVPLELLVTGSCISVNIYERKLACPPKTLTRTHQRGKDSPAYRRYKQLDIETASTASEQSPVKLVLFPPSYHVRSFSNASEREDGYEGSEEESVCEGQPPTQRRLFLLMHLSLVQPHAFLSCHPTKQKFDVSCFDLHLKGVPTGFSVIASGQKRLPNLDDFTVPWIETKPGEPYPKTGIPPAFFTASASDFLHGGGRLNIDMGRPLRIVFSENKYDQIEHVFKRLAHVVKAFHESSQSPENPPQKSSQNPLEIVEKCSAFISSVRLTTDQIVCNIIAVKSKCKSELTFNLGGCELDVESTKTFGPHSRLASIQVGCVVKDAQLKTVYQSLPSRTLIYPWTFSGKSKIFWNSWIQTPYHESQLHSETLLLSVGPENIHSVCHVLDWLKKFLPVIEATPPTAAGKPNENMPNQFHDDLRAGLFQYVTKNNQATPKAYQVLFDKELGWMTWKYPEPRALTKVEIYPIPFISATDTEQCQQYCALQYYDELLDTFSTYQRFQLSESKVCRLDLPGIHEQRLLAVSSMWRVCLDYQEDDTNHVTKLLIVPEALAACMRIDSMFSISNLPTNQAVAIFNKIELSLVNHLALTGTQPPSFLDEYQLDTCYPDAQTFMCICANNLRLRMALWPLTRYVQVSGSLHSSIMNYKYLTGNPFINIPKLQVEFSMREEDNVNKPSCYDLQTKAKTLDLQISQSSVHTITVANQCWNQSARIVCDPSIGLDQTVQSELPMVIPNTIVIRNDTLQSITIGQNKTDEILLMKSGTALLYSWRSHKSPPALRIKLRPWSCNDLVDVTDQNTQILPISRSKGPSTSSSILLVNCRRMGHNMTTVTITGILSIANSLATDLEFLVADNHQDELAKHLNSAGLVKAGKCSHSFIGNPTGIRVRSPGALTSWSGEIPLGVDGSKESFTIKIPNSAKSCLVALCRIVRQRVQNVWRLLVVLSAPFMVRSHLPRALALCLETPSLKTTQKVTLTGRGELETVAIETNTSHQMTFQLSPELEESKPPITITKFMLDQMKQATSKSPCDIDDILDQFNQTAKYQWSKKNDFLSADQPKIDLQVGFALLYPCCNTVVMDVRPWTLIINQTNIEILFTEDREQVWYLGANVVFAPPKLDNLFFLGIPGHQPVFSSPLQLSKDESWYTLNFQGKLPRVGSTNISIQLATSICYLTINSRFEDGIQTLHVLPTYTISKTIKAAITVKCGQQSDPVLLPDGDDSTEHPLLFWAPDKILPLYFSQADHESSAVLFEGLETDSRVSFTIPRDTSQGNEAFLLTIHPVGTQVKFVIQKDPSPQMLIYNNTSLTLVLSQNLVEDDDTLQEEVPTQSRPIAALSRGFYSFPSMSLQFPRFFVDSTIKPRLHLSTVQTLEDESTRNSEAKWSQGIDIHQKYDQFVIVPSIGDVKIHTETVGHTAHVFVDPVSRVEVSPKDIRSRIAGAKTRVVPSTKTPADHHRPEASATFKVFYLTFMCSQMTVVLKDDSSTPPMIKEVIRSTLDDLVVGVRPKIDLSDKLRALNYRVQDFIEVVAYATDLQLDNQLHSDGTSDFPVVLMRRDPRAKALKSYDHIAALPSLSESLCSVACVFEWTDNQVCVQSVRVSTKPLMVFLEDNLAYSMSKFFRVLLEDSSRTVTSSNPSSLDAEIVLKSRALTYPIRVNKLIIEDISIMLSVHGSAKLYFALDHSPLNFKQYHRELVLTTGYALGHNLTMHYLSSALFKAGWVVSSLDLLGNPGGFARTVGSGIKDFVQLPYEGILLGPWAFIAGITYGSLSLVKHLTAGTLVSVTNLASSVARNMERLSMDEEHLVRSEQSRRAQRGGLASGLTQGLSAFGISMLGAIGGIVHQPMQAVLLGGGGPASLVTGLGKGLLGVVVKPIGGAADLLVHTGQSLLQGAGWSPQQKARLSSAAESEAALANTFCKYAWKFKKGCDVIVAVDATLQAADNVYSPVTVLVDKETVRVIAVDKDGCELDPLNLVNLTCKCPSSDPTLLVLEEKIPEPCLSEMEGAPGCSERVADFVRGNCSEVMGVSSDEDDVTSTSEQCIKIRLLLSPQWRSFLISVINIASRRFKTQGFHF